MADVDDSERVWAAEFERLSKHLDERALRLVAAARAAALGPGGVTAVHRASGLARSTIQRGMADLDGEVFEERVRREGAGRKTATDKQPNLLAALDLRVHPYTRGDPMSPLRWTTKSTAKLARELTAEGFTITPPTVAKYLKMLGYSLQAPSKTEEGSDHPDRDAQFQHIADQSTLFTALGQPVISVDAKKKELIGDFHRSGQEWQPVGEPTRVNTHDFIDKELGKVVPYGIYDVARNTGWVNVGVDHDTAEFAVMSVRRWWRDSGRTDYPEAGSLLICADGGGSNGSRVRLWKAELQALATETGLTITVCHFPPGTSKWNKIEHRLFSQITLNMRGRPLTTREVAVNVIGATTTQTGLTVKAVLDTGTYPKGRKVADDEMSRLLVQRNSFHGEWNYTIHPALAAGG